MTSNDAMSPSDADLVQGLTTLNGAIPEFATRVVTGQAAAAEHEALALNLVTAAAAIMARREGLTIDSEPDDLDPASALAVLLRPDTARDAAKLHTARCLATLGGPSLSVEDFAHALTRGQT